MDRRGIGATAAAAVIFSVLLVSNMSVFVSSQDRARLFAQAGLEDLVYDESQTLSVAAAANILIETQSIIQSHTFNCSTARSSLEALIGKVTDSLSGESVTVTASAAVGSEGPAVDNLTALRPFNGSQAGDLNLELHMTLAGGSAPTGVSLDKVEEHAVHLGLRLDRIIGDCESAVGWIYTKASGGSVPNCTSSSVGQLFNAAALAPASAAAADGFQFKLGYGIVNVQSCSVSFAVSISQAGIDGPAGQFTGKFVGGRSASFELQVPPPQA